MTTMADQKVASSKQSLDQNGDHIEEALPLDAHGRDQYHPDYVDHRENDDRADEAKGRNADHYEGKYWLSVNYIGTLFAIGMAFMGGIGGE